MQLRSNTMLTAAGLRLPCRRSCTTIVLQSACPTTAADNAMLKSILESLTIIKVFFDVRNDSDA